MPMSCCQRCSGLYIGAAVALALHLCLRPKLNGRFLGVHGAFLLIMVPFGFHWLPQGAALRAMTGVLCGFAITTFLWLMPATRLGGQDNRQRGRSAWRYGLALGATLLVLPVAANSGGPIVGRGLNGLAVVGFLCLGVLAVINVGLGLRGFVKMSVSNDVRLPLVKQRGRLSSESDIAPALSVPHHGSMYTGIPTHTSLTRYSASQFASRKQPCDSVRPTCSGLGVPCIP
jgi:hypothetical protein